jgi:hypothetical protein
MGIELTPVNDRPLPADYEHWPYGGEINDFCEWLLGAGYSKDSIHGHLRRLFKVLTGTRELGGDEARSSHLF